jgi:hypothetical protein
MSFNACLHLAVFPPLLKPKDMWVEYLDKSNVTLISPPTQFKDIRAWIAAGANRQDVEGLAREAIEDAVGKQVSRCAG